MGGKYHCAEVGCYNYAVFTPEQGNDKTYKKVKHIEVNGTFHTKQSKDSHTRTRQRQHKVELSCVHLFGLFDDVFSAWYTYENKYCIPVKRAKLSQ